MKAKLAFSAAAAMFAAIREAMALPNVADRREAMSDIGAYRSRGKGRGAVSYARGRGSRGGNNAGRGVPHQGPAECARRKQNVANGMCHPGTVKLLHQREVSA